MKKLLLLSLLISNIIFAQDLENSKWYFGDQAALDFNHPPDFAPTALYDSQMAWGGGASVSDANGNLLFYTNGVDVWNSNHGPMDSGSDIGGHIGAHQSAIIVPSVTDQNIYYVFTSSGNTYGTSNGGFHYSTIDMSMNSGLGKVIAKNKSLYYNLFGSILNLDGSLSDKLTTYYNSILNVHWIVIYHDDTYLTFKVDENGIGTGVNDVAEVISPSIYQVAPFQNPIYHNSGYNKISPDGSKFAASYFYEGALYNFDSDTGIISSGEYIGSPLPYSIYTSGLEFSPDSNYLYTTHSTLVTQFPLGKVKRKGGLLQEPKGVLFQVDLRKKPNSKQNNPPQIIANGSFGGLQLGINDKIYIGYSFVGKNHLSVINNPNELGTACNFQEIGVNLGTLVGHSLPQKVADICYNVEWPIVYGETGTSSSNNFGWSIETDLEGNVYEIGLYSDDAFPIQPIPTEFTTFDYEGQPKAFFSKYDKCGELIWIRPIVFYKTMDMFIDDSNQIIISFGSEAGRLFKIGKYSKDNGDLIWENNFSGSKWYTKIDINKSNGDIYISNNYSNYSIIAQNGIFNFSAGNAPVHGNYNDLQKTYNILSKIDTDGNVIWNKEMETAGSLNAFTGYNYQTYPSFIQPFGITVSENNNNVYMMVGLGNNVQRYNYIDNNYFRLNANQTFTIPSESISYNTNNSVSNMLIGFDENGNNLLFQEVSSDVNISPTIDENNYSGNFQRIKKIEYNDDDNLLYVMNSPYSGGVGYSDMIIQNYGTNGALNNVFSIPTSDNKYDPSGAIMKYSNINDKVYLSMAGSIFSLNQNGVVSSLSTTPELNFKDFSTNTLDFTFTTGNYDGNNNAIDNNSNQVLPDLDYGYSLFITRLIDNGSFVFGKQKGDNLIKSDVKYLNNIEDKLLVFPNPTNNSISVSISGKETINGKIELLNSFGEKIISKYYFNESSQVIFDLSKKPAGIYFVKYIDEKGNNIIKKIIKI